MIMTGPGCEALLPGNCTLAPDRTLFSPFYSFRYTDTPSIGDARTTRNPGAAAEYVRPGRDRATALSRARRNHRGNADGLVCHEYIQALEECHARGMWARWTGVCNDQKRALNLCLRQEVRAAISTVAQIRGESDEAKG